ncbi:peptidoglycan editing factor PgeF [Pelagibacteraceae bacterium]|nr:peptidoglycan editing factor PgeF [Pelagibacteraceae bacterium]
MYFSKKIKEFNNVKHCFFSKNGGVSKGIYDSLNCGFGSLDKKENIFKNFSIVSQKMGVPSSNLFSMNQTHSNKVVIINEENKNIQRISSDALITKLKGIAISVLTADCVPILVYDEVNQIIACIHSGWKGTINGIIENTFNKIISMGKNNKIYVGVGPCIGVKNYEVGKEFYNKFIKEAKDNEVFFYPSKENKFFFNLRECVNSKIKKFNVECVENIDLDTFSEKEKFFSFRRSKKMDEIDYGRCISTIGLIDN